MIGIVVVTHGRLALEFIAALEHIVGKQEQVCAVCIGPEDDMEERRAEILRSVAQMDSGDGVVILTDMFGGTPSNLAISVMGVGGTPAADGETARGPVEVIAGINLPLLVKLASLRTDRRLDEAVVGAADAGRKYVSVASHLLSESEG